MLQLLDRGCVSAACAVAGVAGTLALAAVGAGTAYAGQWMRTTCVNPDNSPASSDGWKGFTSGIPPAGSTAKSTCGPGDPMGVALSTGLPAPGEATEGLEYEPPTGSTLVGGTLLLGATADGYGRGAGPEYHHAIANATVFTPEYVPVVGNLPLYCALSVCHPFETTNYYGSLELPANRGGGLFLTVSCVGAPVASCYEGGSHGAWARIALGSANLLLSTSSLPTATDFHGDLLEPNAHGTAGLAFTAADGGPGIYKVTVTIDDKPVYDATPNANSGKCVAGGTDPGTGALYFQWQQPCPQSQTVDTTIRTTTLSDGPHELKVTVLNAAQDSAIVLRRTITTNNRTTVSSTLTSDKPASPIAAPPAPIYAVELDAATKKLVGGVRRRWSQSGFTLGGTLRNSAGVPAPGVLVTLFSRNATQPAHEAVARATTDASGHWVLAAPRGPSRLLTVSYGEHPDPAAAQAIRIRQTVKPGVTLRVQALGHGRLRFTGKLSIKPLGTPRPLVAIQTRTRNGKHWQAVGSSLRVNSAGNYSVTYDGGPNVIGGSYAFRSVVNATSLFSTGISPIRRKVVR